MASSKVNATASTASGIRASSGSDTTRMGAPESHSTCRRNSPGAMEMGDPEGSIE
jgi:hypothetical protein